MPRDRGERRVPGLTYLDDVRTPADQLVLRLTDEVYSEVADLLDTVQRLYQERAGMREGPTSDNARRRLQHHRLRTPYLSHCIGVLRTKSVDLQEEIADRMTALVKPMIKLELVRAELDVALALEAQLEAERATRANDEVHPAIAEFAEILFTHYGVTRWHLAAATPDQVCEVAQVFRRNVPDESGGVEQGTHRGGDHVLP